MIVNQSSHRWNNYQSIDETWLPMKGQIASVISINAATNYRERVPDLDGLTFDIYFLHKKLFGNSKTIVEMALANPGIIVRHMARNARAYLTTAVSMTNLGQILYSFTTFGRSRFDETAKATGRVDHRYVSVVFSLAFGILFLIMGRRMWRAPKRREVLIFALALVTVATVSALLSKGDTNRFIYVIYGVYAIMAAFYAERMLAHPRALIGALSALTVLVLLTQGGWARADARLGWGGVVRAFNGLGTVSIAEIFYAGDGQQTFAALKKQTTKCKGLMPTEMPQFIGTFSTTPLRRLYSPYEIPPFGKYGDSDYTGLRKNRIDCIYVPKSLFGAGLDSPNNLRLRHRSYLKPYMQKLLDEGGGKIKLPAGTLVVGGGQ